MKLFLQADRKSSQALKHRLPPIIDAIEALAEDDLADQLLAGSGPDPVAMRPTRHLTIGFVLSETETPSADRLTLLAARFPPPLEIGSVFVLPRVPDFTAFEAWCATRVRTMLDYLLGEYAASQLATAGLRRQTEQLERSLAQAEATFIEFRREPLKLAYRAERAGSFALPRPLSDDGGPQSLEIRQTLHGHIANVRYIDVQFNGDASNLEGTVRFTARGAWSGKLLCDSTADIRDLAPGWTQFRCDPLDGGDEEPLAIELHMSGPDLGWLMPGFSHISPVPDDCASIVGHDPIGRPLALRVWSGIPGIESPPRAGSPGPGNGNKSGAGRANILSIAPEQLGMAELVSKLPPELEFAPVSYNAATQSLLVHPLGHRPTVARLPPISVTNLSALSAIVQLTEPEAQPTDFGLLALPSSGRGRAMGARPASEDIDLDGVIWHEFRAREWGEIELHFPEPRHGEVRIHLLTRTLSDNHDYTSAYFRGLKLTCGPSAGAE